MVICLKLGADLHMAQLTPLPLTVSCFSKNQTGFTFLAPANLGSPRKRAIKRVYYHNMTVTHLERHLYDEVGDKIVNLADKKLLQQTKTTLTCSTTGRHRAQKPNF